MWRSSSNSNNLTLFYREEIKEKCFGMIPLNDSFIDYLDDYCKNNELSDYESKFVDIFSKENPITIEIIWDDTDMSYDEIYNVFINTKYNNIYLKIDNNASKNEFLLEFKLTSKVGNFKNDYDKEILIVIENVRKHNLECLKNNDNTDKNGNYVDCNILEDIITKLDNIIKYSGEYNLYYKYNDLIQ